MKRYDKDNYAFIINRVKCEDRGEYIIRAENSWGVTEEFVFLDVKRKSKFYHVSTFSSNVLKTWILNRQKIKEFF